VTRQCKLLALNRSTVYYQPHPVSEQDLQLMRRIDELHLTHPYYGARRMAKQLRREGRDVQTDGASMYPSVFKHRPKIEHFECIVSTPAATGLDVGGLVG
jgi:hypothetical protein